MSGHTLSLNGTGVGGAGALVNLSGANSWDGPVNLATSSTVNVAATTTLNLSGGGAGASTSDLTKIGTGALVFPTLTAPAANTYLGQTIINAGTVEVESTLGNVKLAGGTLSGTGTVGSISTTSNAAILHPGNSLPTDSVGTLNTADVTLNPADQVFISLGDSAPATVRSTSPGVAFNSTVPYSRAGSIRVSVLVLRSPSSRPITTR